MTLHYNASLDRLITLPSVFHNERCMSIEHSGNYDYTVSACQNNYEVYLYTTVYSSSKPFVLESYYSSAK